MINNIKKNLTSSNLVLRIVTTYICFLLIFFTVTIVSYYLLPEGLLRNKHPLQNWSTSPNILVSAVQILSYNLLSVVVILFANIFSWRTNKAHSFMPLGYLAFFAQITINAVVLVTWSFSVVAEAVPLLYRLIGIFDLVHRAALWEMSGQLFILCATVTISLIITDGKETTRKSWKTIKLSKQEIFAFGIGLILMLTGAFIESYSILQLA